LLEKRVDAADADDRHLHLDLPLLLLFLGVELLEDLGEELLAPTHQDPVPLQLPLLLNGLQELYLLLLFLSDEVPLVEQEKLLFPVFIVQKHFFPLGQVHFVHALLVLAPPHVLEVPPVLDHRLVLVDVVDHASSPSSV